LCLAAKRDSLDANQENTIGQLVGGAPIGSMQACDLAFHAAPSFWPT
jgi:hypothetical protein